MTPLPEILELICTRSRADPAGIDKSPVRAIVPQQQRSDERAAPVGVGPAHDHKFFPVEALGLEPEPVLAQAIADVQPFREKPLYANLMSGKDPIDYQLGAGYKRRFVRGQEQHAAGHLDRLADPAQRRRGFFSARSSALVAFGIGGI